MCCTIWLFDIGLVETFGQSLHWNCLPSSLCVLKWEVRFALRLNFFSQRSHLKSLESLCWIMWLLRWSLPTKSLLHSWHFVCLSWTCLYEMCLFNVSPRIICWQMSQNTDLTFSQPLMLQVDAELAFFSLWDVNFNFFTVIESSIWLSGWGMGWGGIYCWYGVATALKIAHWSQM